MNSILLTTILQLAAAAPATPTLDAALATASETGKPVLLLMGAEWCPYCQVVVRDVLPQLEKAGLMKQVVFVYLDFDLNRQLALQLKRGPVIPEMIMFNKNGDQWKQTHLFGGYKLAEIETFIKTNLPGAAGSAVAAPADDSVATSAEQSP